MIKRVSFGFALFFIGNCSVVNTPHIKIYDKQTFQNNTVQNLRRIKQRKRFFCCAKKADVWIRKTLLSKNKMLHPAGLLSAAFTAFL